MNYGPTTLTAKQYVVGSILRKGDEAPGPEVSQKCQGLLSAFNQLLFLLGGLVGRRELLARWSTAPNFPSVLLNGSVTGEFSRGCDVHQAHAVPYVLVLK